MLRKVLCSSVRVVRIFEYIFERNFESSVVILRMMLNNPKIVNNLGC